ncbi:MAG: FAD-dependent monooxygenase [Verrucomicrobiae bacterium]|nr:FAD-dependent monooxygenase [Verrucomicrobiae bacterium]
MHRGKSNVLIVGAGPVGLTLACDLLRRGVRPRLIDRLAQPSPYCRAIGITPRSLELWEGLGIVPDLLDAGLWLTGLRSIVDGIVRDHPVHLDDLPYSSLAVPQYETERILTRRLEALGGAIERGVECVGLTEGEQGVQVSLVDAAGERKSADFRFVVGCDGAHSAVRKALGIPFEGSALPYEFMLGDVRIAWDEPRGMAVQSVHPVSGGPPDIFIAVPLPERGRYRVSMFAPAEVAVIAASEVHGIQSERPAPGLPALQAVADRLLPGKAILHDIRWSSIFRIGMRLAARYRSGNTFLAGDAAHIHPPTGGQGMNTGIQDACNLAWKLALVAEGAAPPTLLESYEAERRPVGQEVIERTTRASMRFAAPAPEPEAAAVKQARLADTQILVHYRSSPWVATWSGATGLRPGDRVPDCLGLRRAGVGYPLRLFDLLRSTDHAMLAFLPQASAREDGRATKALRFLAARSAAAGRLRILLVAAKADAIDRVESFDPGITCCHDEAGTFGSTFGPPPRFVLVRPDGYAAWCGTSLDDSELARVLAATFVAT